VQEGSEREAGCVERGQLARADRLGGHVDDRVERLQQPPVRDADGQHAEVLSPLEHGQAAGLHREPALPDIAHVVEGRGAPEERQLRPDRDHGGGERPQAAVGIVAAARPGDRLLPQVDRPVPDRAQQVVAGGVVLVQGGAPDPGRLGHLGQRRGRVRDQHLSRDVQERRPGTAAKRRDVVNTHVHNNTSLFLTGQQCS
jgi:hypothetical protein